MRPYNHTGGYIFAGDTGSQRETATNAFRSRHNVWFSPIDPLMCEELARPTCAALHFVIDQQYALFVTELTQLPQAVFRHGPQTALTLYRLDENSGGLVRYGGI